MLRTPVLPVVFALALAAACDPLDIDRPDDGTGTTLTVQALQDPSAPDHPAIGDRVVVDNAVITAVDEFDEDGEGRTGSIWVQDARGGAWSGVQLFAPTVIPSRSRLFPGDVARVLGTIDEFVLLGDDGTPLDRNGTLTEVTDAAVQKTGETLPLEPITIREADLATAEAAEPWEGVLVRIENVRMRSSYDDNGEAPTVNGIDIANDLYEIPGLAADSTYRSVAGVVTYFFGFKILPRGPDDVVP